MTLALVTLLDGEGAHARVRLADGAEIQTRVPRGSLDPGASHEVGLRPEHVHVVATDAATLTAKADLVERLGDRTFVYARLGNNLPITAEDAGDSRVRIGDTIGLRINGAAAHLFAADGTAHHAEAAG